MTNTNVINNANTTVYATVENRNVNDNSQMLMIGEELLCVRKAHDTMYIVNDATQAYVQAYVHQVVGNIACDTVVTQEGNDVHVTLKEVDLMACGPVYVSIFGIFDSWLYEGVTGWDQTFQIRDKLEAMGIFLPVAEVERQYALWEKGFEATDTTDHFGVDSAEELAMQAEAAYLAYYEGGSVDTDVDYLAYYESGVDIGIDLELGF